MKLKTDITNNVKIAVPNIKRRTPSNMFKAVMKGGGIVKVEAQSRASSRKIANAIKVIGRNTDGSPESHTGFDKKAKGWYGKFLESGTKKHDIKPKKGKVLSWIIRSGGKVEFTSRTGKKTLMKYYVAKDGQHTLDASEEGRTYITIVHHPGMKKDPFLIPAYKAKVDEIKQVVSNAITDTIMEGTRDDGS